MTDCRFGNLVDALHAAGRGVKVICSASLEVCHIDSLGYFSIGGTPHFPTVEDTMEGAYMIYDRKSVVKKFLLIDERRGGMVVSTEVEAKEEAQGRDGIQIIELRGVRQC
jgi:hypothetical protein